MSFKVGELVKWVTEYDDYLARDAGVGIVLGATAYTYAAAKHTSYEIYRNKKEDKIFLSDSNVFKLHKKEK